MMCKKLMERVCKAWYSVPPNIIEELYNSLPRRNADLIKAKGAETKYWLYDIGVQCCVFSLECFKVCCCVLVGMHLKFIFKCCLIIR